jgi:hypothetical protein
MARTPEPVHVQYLPALKALKPGQTIAALAEELGVPAGRLYRARAAAIDNGLLSRELALTYARYCTLRDIGAAPQMGNIGRLVRQLDPAVLGRIVAASRPRETIVDILYRLAREKLDEQA